MFHKNKFGEEFKFGVSSSAFQTEGAFQKDEAGLSIWDDFTQKRWKVKKNQNAKIATNFYENFEEDLQILQGLNCNNFRFSIAWSRVLPNGTGFANSNGIDFYDRLIDSCLEKNISPWITLYHWDLPLELEKKGGWKNRDVLFWLEEYIQLCLNKYADRVDNWMVLNEPTAFTALGYYLGIHAPGKKGLRNFLPSMHHAAMAQAQGGRQIKDFNEKLNVGTTFSMSHVKAKSRRSKDIAAKVRVDALLNRLYLEPALGLGYPLKDLPGLAKVEKYMQEGDYEKLKFDFDFIGVQNYSREVVSHSYFTPIINAKLVTAKMRNKKLTAMGWEFYPKAIYKVLKNLKKYDNLPPIVITESGVALDDKMEKNGTIKDHQRIKFLQKNLKQVLKAKDYGVNVVGYFVWSFTDNFEWAEGYHPRFGLVYVNFKTQERILKNSAKWYRKFLADN